MSERVSLDGEWQLGHCAIGEGERMGFQEIGYQAEDRWEFKIQR